MWSVVRRSMAGSLVVVMLAGACSDDDPATAPLASTSTVAPSTTTVAPVDTTPESTTPPPTTAPSTTAPSTTASPAGGPVVVIEPYTTDDMRTQLAATHTYLGGWLVVLDDEWAVELWGRGTGPEAADWYREGGEVELWISQLLRREADGTPVWNKRDVVVSSHTPDLGLEFSALCRRDGERVDGVFAWYDATSDEQWVAAVEAWQIDADAATAVAVDPSGVDCENAAYGV